MDEGPLIESRRLLVPPKGAFWVFGYGSLMWRPEFPFVQAASALLRGWHRAFCIWSVHYRGTVEKPGLVLGLDRGGACRGRAFRIAPEHAIRVADYLHEREMVTGVYEPRYVTVELEGGKRVRAATYLADHRHPQYAGKLAPAKLLRIIREGHGSAGSNLDYLRNTVRHLDQLGIADGPLHRILAQAEKAETRGRAKG
ncbi:gamma-glutamylcyclotransferase [Hypericibacter adhaerens]|jgi:cation transport protein ChaC|uniref:glutathione-specific gamma-glutamylcyclotransferase n=1 Tax=Hypericibacter adhaerens TaxID=2602016 RepID=A0A5J6N511_9PROT|nr:gamma-glutamylcyclotransferase [Hypericibacter adhaerens]QEX24507.1 gamma-glutamylcyclotransferase [Hypericibacter adhaerens]HVY50601.1 gamma-glutamylcyclotransferase [Devosia sp.]